MRKYDKEFKEEAVKPSDEIGVKQATAQLGIPYCSLAEWRQMRTAFGDHAFVGSGIRRDAPLSESERRLIKEIAELGKANEILKNALGFSPKTGNGKAGAAICVHYAAPCDIPPEIRYSIMGSTS